MIQSLLVQSLQPCQFVLYLSLEEFPARDVPRALGDLVSGRFEIRYVAENLGPYNKLLYALDDFPHATIVTCDDDRIYPRSWLADLAQAAAETPNTVIGAVGRRTAAREGGFAPYADWPYETEGRVSFWTLPLGGYGVLYPWACLDPRVNDGKLAAALAPRQDDLWFKTMSLLRDVPCRTLGVEGLRYPELSFPDDQPLWPKNIDGGGNDWALRRIFDHFGLSLGGIAAKEERLRAEP